MKIDVISWKFNVTRNKSRFELDVESEPTLNDTHYAHSKIEYGYPFCLQGESIALHAPGIIGLT